MMVRLLLRRVREHRVLFAASLLAGVVGTTVLSTLFAFGTAVGDTGLRRVLGERSAGPASLVVSADVPRERLGAAHRAVVAGAGRVFDGLPVSVRRLERSGPYALPAPAGAAAGDRPD
ncbi:peptide ABC transporter permease, partial [Streptomyces solincola]